MDFWVFAYGSLMWRPEFDYVEAVPSILEGAHRSLCLYSHIHRGTLSAPGLVFGLDKGGSCRGLAFRIAQANENKTRAYLRRRENVTNAYIATASPVRLSDGSRRMPVALSYRVDRGHGQYAGALPLEKQAFLVRRSAGASGANLDYVVATGRHLRELGINDVRVERLMTVLGYGSQKQHAAESAG